MTVDEELEHFADALRRLKIEYDAYLSGGARRPPNVLLARVEKLIKKYGAGNLDLTYRQRYRFSQLAQSYFSNKNLWRRKQKARDEGGAAERRHHEALPDEESFSISWADPDRESEKVRRLLDAVIRARFRTGETAEFDSGRFAAFIREKTRQYRESLDCDLVCFTVSVEGGRVKLRARRGET